MEKTTLLIMAAGIGSRFGGGIKQLTPVGPNGEILMDYSIYDAREAGFDEVVFIIRHDLEKDFKEVIGERISKVIPVKYAFQELDDLPEGFQKPAGRTKPWGTGQAVLSARKWIENPFAVINADDYYGKEAYANLHKHLTAGALSKEEQRQGIHPICMAGFLLQNTLSENGGVTRGICEVDECGNLIEVKETYGIQWKDGILCAEDEGGNAIRLQGNPYVSMNMWGLLPEFLDELGQRFQEFLSQIEPGDLKAEYLLPKIIDRMLREGRASVKVLETKDQWFGVTYSEDRQGVTDAICRFVEQGLYKTKLF